MQSAISSTVPVPSVHSEQQVPSDDLSLRSSVLETIRSRLDITTLFTTQLKLSLPAFFEDQVLMKKVARCLHPIELPNQETVDSVRAVLTHQGIFQELQTRLPMELVEKSSQVMDSMLQSLSEELLHPSEVRGLTESLIARVFTIRNALWAQNEPQKIQGTLGGSQKLSVAEIQRRGGVFFRESLRCHLDALVSRDTVPFRAQLDRSAHQLIPFVRTITKLVLEGHQKNCGADPLVYRDRTGYNSQAHVASTVMGCSLIALGFQGSIMNRFDLEPTVNIATSHSLVFVRSPDRLTYLVDCAYQQFHKDVCFDDAALPQDPLLIMEENEVEEHVERNIMAPWKGVSERIRRGDGALRSFLAREDRLMPYDLTETVVVETRGYSDQESWVRKAFRRVWDCHSYTPTHVNSAIQEIFLGFRDDGQVSQAYEQCKKLDVAGLTSFLPIARVKERLNTMMIQDFSREKNLPEAISLIGHLPSSERKEFRKLLDVDPRLFQPRGGLQVLLNAYFRALKRVVNGDGQDKTVLYACSGADCMTVLLATDASRLIFVDQSETSLAQFQKALEGRVCPERLKLMSYEHQKNMLSGGSSLMGIQERKVFHLMENMEWKVFYELEQIGVSKEQITLRNESEGVCVEFLWQYHGASAPRKRSILFLTADITQPSSYPPTLRRLLATGIDIFYMKASANVPYFYPAFLPRIASSIRVGGWMMTSDKTQAMDLVNPEPCLAQARQHFTLTKNPEIENFEEFMGASFSPFLDLPILKIADRASRPVGSDITYWAYLHLRQKTV